MKRSAIVILAGMFTAGAALAQSEKDLQRPQETTGGSAAQAQAVNASLPNGASIDAVLTKSLDSKKAKKGDPVSARITEDAKEQNGKTVIPKGSKLEGHVTQASSQEKGNSYSTLGIVFDKAILKNGEEVSLNVQVQALALSQDAATAPAQMNSMAPPMGSSGGSPAAGSGRPGSAGEATSGMSSAPRAPITTTNTAANTDTNNAMAGKGVVGGLNSSGRLNPGSRGVFGLAGIGLATASEGTEQAAIVTSTDKNVHLDGGTQLLLVTQPPPKS